MPHGLDHIVHAVRDLDAAAEFYLRAGFTVGGRNRHPWGTHNRIVQLKNCYIEILEVAEPEKIVPHAARSFSFGAFHRLNHSGFGCRRTSNTVDRRKRFFSEQDHGHDISVRWLAGRYPRSGQGWPARYVNTAPSAAMFAPGIADAAERRSAPAARMEQTSSEEFAIEIVALRPAPAETCNVEPDLCK